MVSKKNFVKGEQINRKFNSSYFLFEPLDITNNECQSCLNKLTKCNKACNNCKRNNICSTCSKHKTYKNECFIITNFYNIHFNYNDDLFIILIKELTKYNFKLKSKYINLLKDQDINQEIYDNYHGYVKKFIEFIKLNVNSLIEDHLNNTILLNFLDLIHNRRYVLYDSILKNNIIGYGFSLVFVKYSHSCDPNLELVVNKGKYYSSVLYSKQQVNKGDLLTINYLSNYLNIFMRRDLIKNIYKFECNCSKCVTEYSKYQQIISPLNYDSPLLNNDFWRK